LLASCQRHENATCCERARHWFSNPAGIRSALRFNEAQSATSNQSLHREVMKNQIILKSFDDLSHLAANNLTAQPSSQTATSPAQVRSTGNPPATAASQAGDRQEASATWRGCPAEAEAWSG
jgi:hypothetical protein